MVNALIFCASKAVSKFLNELAIFQICFKHESKKMESTRNCYGFNRFGLSKLHKIKPLIVLINILSQVAGFVRLFSGETSFASVFQKTLKAGC